MYIYGMFIRSSEPSQVAPIFLPFLPRLPTAARGARSDRANLPCAIAATRFARPRAGMPGVKAGSYQRGRSVRARRAEAPCVIGQTQAVARALRAAPGRAG